MSPNRKATLMRDSDSWIQTWMGVQFWPLDPRPSDISIEDIAHALSLICRFQGQCNQMYSVAEHSVRVSQIVSPKHALWGLLHDAPEAYICDLASPIKRRKEFSEYRCAEHRLMDAVCDCFGLDPEEPEEVAIADAVMLATEVRDLLGTPPAPWPPLPEPLGERIRPWSSAAAEAAFLDTFATLAVVIP